MHELRLQPEKYPYRYQPIIRMTFKNRLKQKGELAMPEQTAEGTNVLEKQTELTSKQRQKQKQTIPQKPPPENPKKCTNKRHRNNKKQASSTTDDHQQKTKYLQVPTRATKTRKSTVQEGKSHPRTQTKTNEQRPMRETIQQHVLNVRENIRQEHFTSRGQIQNPT